MTFDPSTFSAEQRRIMHRAGRGDGDAARDAAWIALLNGQRSGQGVMYCEDHTPDGGALTGANLAASIVAAVNAAKAAGYEVVQIPPGNYYMNATDEILISAADRTKGIVIRGAGYEKTQLIYPTGYTGTAFTFKGSPPDSPSFLVGGGIIGLVIACATEDASNTGVGIRIEGCINSTFAESVVRNFTGGTCFKSTRGEPDYTNQYVQFYNFTCAGGYINYDLTSLVNSQGYGVFSGSARHRDFLLDDAKFAIFGGYMQSSPPICMELTGQGGCEMVLHDVYHEGFPGTIFKMAMPAVTFNRLEVYSLHLGSSPDIFAEIDANCAFSAHYINRIGTATTILKARNGGNANLVGCGDPVDQPGKFDLDTASRAALVCVSNGSTGVTFTGSKMAADKGFTTPGFATGGEPTGSTGDVTYNTTDSRLAFKTDSGWKRVGISDDPVDLTSLLEPYAAEIFDPGVYKTRSIVSGNLDALTGLLNGSTVSAPAAGQRPTWTAADDLFGGKPSFTCALTGNHYLQGALATTIAAGAYAGLFVVYAVPGGTDDPVNRRVIAGIEHAADHGSLIIVGQSDLNQSNKVYSFASGTNSGTFAVGATGTDAYGHVAYASNSSLDSFVHVYRDVEATATGLTPGVSGSIIDRVTLGGVWDSAAYVGCNITIAYVAVLSSTLSPDTITKVRRAALAKYNLR
jgi:hypothetical protein